MLDWATLCTWLTCVFVSFLHIWNIWIWSTTLTLPPLPFPAFLILSDHLKTLLLYNLLPGAYRVAPSFRTKLFTRARKRREVNAVFARANGASLGFFFQRNVNNKTEQSHSIQLESYILWFCSNVFYPLRTCTILLRSTVLIGEKDARSAKMTEQERTTKRRSQGNLNARGSWVNKLCCEFMV